MAARRMSDAEIARRKKLQGNISRTTATLGLAALGTRLAAPAAPKIGRLTNRASMGVQAGRRLHSASGTLTTVGAGVGGAGGYNFAAYTGAEAKRRPPAQVRKHVTDEYGYDLQLSGKNDLAKADTQDSTNRRLTVDFLDFGLSGVRQGYPVEDHELPDEVAKGHYGKGNFEGGDVNEFRSTYKQFTKPLNPQDAPKYVRKTKRQDTAPLMKSDEVAKLFDSDQPKVKTYARPQMRINTHYGHMAPIMPNRVEYEAKGRSMIRHRPKYNATMTSNYPSNKINHKTGEMVGDTMPKRIYMPRKAKRAMEEAAKVKSGTKHKFPSGTEMTVVHKAYDPERNRQRRLQHYSTAAAFGAGAAGAGAINEGRKAIKGLHATSLPKYKAGVKAGAKGAALTAVAAGGAMAADRLQNYRRNRGGAFKPLPAPAGY